MFTRAHAHPARCHYISEVIPWIMLSPQPSVALLATWHPFCNNGCQAESPRPGLVEWAEQWLADANLKQFIWVLNKTVIPLGSLFPGSSTFTSLNENAKAYSYSIQYYENLTPPVLARRLGNKFNQYQSTLSPPEIRGRVTVSISSTSINYFPHWKADITLNTPSRFQSRSLDFCSIYSNSDLRVRRVSGG
jgi:hypothetical protein